MKLMSVTVSKPPSAPQVTCSSQGIQPLTFFVDLLLTFNGADLIVIKVEKAVLPSPELCALNILLVLKLCLLHPEATNRADYMKIC